LCLQINSLLRTDENKAVEIATDMAKRVVKRKELERIARNTEFTKEDKKNLLDSEIKKLTKPLTENQVRNAHASISHLKSKIKEIENESKANDSMMAYFKSTVSSWNIPLLKFIFCEISLTPLQ